MNGLLQSRKFWLAVQDAVVSTALLLSSLYLPEQADTIKLIVGFWQIPTSILIIAITVEDAALKHATGAPYRGK